ncbi:hypothetical protein K1T71_000605 [Dendrolimus kikuchii]|uniref:Uncharacterized protein n=1 Tax=Dendrolimus kikuchii TaxID=765133 RepID=A0ACC1DKL0_9NEOP|nr:hypothetical protein K1T71_000605 [Dendrolimus kikuchii]
MSSYGSMSPSDEGFDRYEPPFYCQPSHQGSPMDGGVYWPASNGDMHEFDSQDVYHDSTHYISRSYGYEEMQITGNEPYDNYHHSLHQTYVQNSTGLDCDMQALPLRYDRPNPPTFVRVVKRRTTANKKERRRTQSINTAFSDLRDCIPNVPPDTKLSKILRSARISTAFTLLSCSLFHTQLSHPYLRPDCLHRVAAGRRVFQLLRPYGEHGGGFPRHQHSTNYCQHPPPQPRASVQTQNSIEKRSKGRTGWPQHVWALELKTEQNLQT